MDQIRSDPSFFRFNSFLKRLISCTSVSASDDCVFSAVSDPDLSVADFVLLMCVYQNSILEV